tara:strand:- start:495 stop:1163 length:669 start_codon:yes stop_codon:yes gene_type:complete
MKYHILLGDDNKSNTHHYEILCKQVSPNIDVVIASDFDELEKKLSDIYDGIFIDLTFPGYDEKGPDKLDEFMREREIKTRVVCMSADYSKTSQEREFPGRMGYLDKADDDPVDHDNQFKELVKRMITQDSEEQEIEFIENRCKDLECLDANVENTNDLRRDYNVSDGLPSSITTETATYRECLENLKSGEIEKDELRKDLLRRLSVNILKKKIKPMKPMNQQ